MNSKEWAFVLDLAKRAVKDAINTAKVSEQIFGVSAPSFGFDLLTELKNASMKTPGDMVKEIEEIKAEIEHNSGTLGPKIDELFKGVI